MAGYGVNFTPNRVPQFVLFTEHITSEWTPTIRRGIFVRSGMQGTVVHTDLSVT